LWIADFSLYLIISESPKKKPDPEVLGVCHALLLVVDTAVPGAVVGLRDWVTAKPHPIQSALIGGDSNRTAPKGTFHEQHARPKRSNCKLVDEGKLE